MGKQIFLSHQFICFVWLFSKNGIRTLFLCSSNLAMSWALEKNFFVFLFPSFLYFQSIDTNTTKRKTHNLLYNCQAYKKMLSVMFLLINIIFSSHFTRFSLRLIRHELSSNKQNLRQKSKLRLGGVCCIVSSLEFATVLLYNIFFLFGWRTTSWTRFF